MVMFISKFIKFQAECWIKGGFCDHSEEIEKGYYRSQWDKWLPGSFCCTLDRAVSKKNLGKGNMHMYDYTHTQIDCT